MAGHGALSRAAPGCLLWQNGSPGRLGRSWPAWAGVAGTSVWLPHYLIPSCSGRGPSLAACPGEVGQGHSQGGAELARPQWVGWAWEAGRFKFRCQVTFCLGSIDCAGILKLRNSDIELWKGETDIGRKNTRVRLVFRVHVPQPSGRTLSLQVASNPIECCE